MTIATDQADHSTAMLAQADIFLLLADYFRAPLAQPTSPASGADPADVRALVSAAMAQPGDLSDTLIALLQTRSNTTPQEISDEYYRLFEGAIVCPLNQTAYVRRDKGAVLGDLCAFYEAFGWRADQQSAEKPDHIVCELEFISLGLVMAAAAARSGELQNQQITSDAMANFADTHLADWVNSLCDRLEHTAHLPLFSQLASTLRQAWKLITAQNNWRNGLDQEVLPPTQDPDSPYECAAPGMPTQAELTVGATDKLH